MPSRQITVLDSNNEPCGPFELIEVQRRLQAREFKPDQLAHADGLAEWEPLTNVIAHVLGRPIPQKFVPHAPQPAPAPVLYAGFWRRLAAFVIDALIIIIALDLPLALLCHLIAPKQLLALAEGDPVSPWVRLLIITPFFVGPIYYFSVMESGLRQATFGKQALGILVTDLKGNRLTFWQAFARTAAKLITNLTAIALYFGYIMAAFTPKKQALHDFIAKTLVVRK